MVRKWSAIRAGAQYLITTDVDDFAFDDLAAHGMSAVNPDYFMASRFTAQAYMEGQYSGGHSLRKRMAPGPVPVSCSGPKQDVIGHAYRESVLSFDREEA